MSIYLERARELRACEDPHYNCAQSVLVPFAEQAGMTTEQALAVAQGFGGGMQTGGICGAISGGVMALGVLGIATPRTVSAFVRRMRDNHGGMTQCVDLLRANREAGGEKKPHCDAMVFESVALVEEFLASAAG